MNEHDEKVMTLIQNAKKEAIVLAGALEAAERRGGQKSQDRIRQLEDALRAIADNEFYSNENGSIEDAKEFSRRALGESK